MGRIVPHAKQDHREYLLIELKRPSLNVGRKELDQLEDYVSTIVSQPDFVSSTTSWNFYLVSTEIDASIEPRITQQGRPSGLFIDQGNYKVWVKSWSELINDCESRLAFAQKELNINVSNDEIADRIARLRSSVLKLDTDD